MFESFVEGSVLVKDLRAECAVLLSAKTTLTRELKEKTEEAESSKDQLKNLRFDLECERKSHSLDTERKLAELRKEMHKDLVKSDISRTEAIAKLETYEKTDTKADANHRNEAQAFQACPGAGH